MNKAKELKKEKARKNREWRKKVVEVYSGKCIICGDTNRPNAHHIIPKNFIETRWDEKNGVLLCPLHHRFGKFSAHLNPLWFINMLKHNDEKKYIYLTNKLCDIRDANNN